MLSMVLLGPIRCEQLPIGNIRIRLSPGPVEVSGSDGIGVCCGVLRSRPASPAFRTGTTR